MARTLRSFLAVLTGFGLSGCAVVNVQRQGIERPTFEMKISPPETHVFRRLEGVVRPLGFQPVRSDTPGTAAFVRGYSRERRQGTVPGSERRVILFIKSDSRVPVLLLTLVGLRISGPVDSFADAVREDLQKDLAAEFGVTGFRDTGAPVEQISILGGE